MGVMTAVPVSLAPGRCPSGHPECGNQYATVGFFMVDAKTVKRSYPVTAKMGVRYNRTLFRHLICTKCGSGMEATPARQSARQPRPVRKEVVMQLKLAIERGMRFEFLR